MVRSYLNSFLDFFKISRKKRFRRTMDQEVEDRLFDNGFFDDHYVVFHLEKQQWLRVYRTTETSSKSKDLAVWFDDFKLLDVNFDSGKMNSESSFELMILDILVRDGVFEGEPFSSILVVPLKNRTPDFTQAVKLYDLNGNLLD